jgi:hypothetical protein
MSTIEKLYAMERNDAISLLRDSYGTFCDAISEVLETRPLPPIVAADDSPREQSLVAAATTLRNEGVAILPGLLSHKESLEQGCVLADLLKERADLLTDRSKGVGDTELGGWIWQSDMPTMYRAGIPPERLPAGIRRFVEGDLLTRIIGMAAIPGQRKIEPTLTVIDHMLPTTEYEYQWWHQDRVCDQYKAMILLDEVTPENGPMQILPRSQEFHGARRMIDFSIFVESSNFGEIPFNMYGKMRKQVVKLTGKPGDVILFNTRAFHAMGRPSAGRRKTMTVYFTDVDTHLNRFLNDFNPGFIL